jgi:hypothetical protein
MFSGLIESTMNGKGEVSQRYGQTVWVLLADAQNAIRTFMQLQLELSSKKSPLFINFGNLFY